MKHIILPLSAIIILVVFTRINSYYLSDSVNFICNTAAIAQEHAIRGDWEKARQQIGIMRAGLDKDKTWYGIIIGQQQLDRIDALVSVSSYALELENTEEFTLNLQELTAFLRGMEQGEALRWDLLL